MKIKQLCKWQMINLRVSLMVFYGIMTGVYLLSGIVSIFIEDMKVTASVSSAVFLFVMNMVFFHETLKVGLGNGISRKTILVSNGILMLAMVVVTAVADYLLCWFFNLVFQMENFNFITLLYQSKVYVSSFWGERVFVTILFSSAVGLLFATLGYFMGALNYRMSKPLRLIVYIGTPVLLLVGFPILVKILPKDFNDSILNFLSNMMQLFKQSPYYPILFLVGVAIILSLLSGLLVRRVPLKTV